MVLLVLARVSDSLLGMLDVGLSVQQLLLTNDDDEDDDDVVVAVVAVAAVDSDDDEHMACTCRKASV